MGTLLRSAEACGVHGVLFPVRRSAPIGPAAIKASAGAVEHLLLVPLDDFAGGLADLHARGLRLVGADESAPLAFRDADLRGPLALVVGSEGRGIAVISGGASTWSVRIPMRGRWRHSTRRWRVGAAVRGGRAARPGRPWAPPAEPAWVPEPTSSPEAADADLSPGPSPGDRSAPSVSSRRRCGRGPLPVCLRASAAHGRPVPLQDRVVFTSERSGRRFDTSGPTGPADPPACGRRSYVPGGVGPRNHAREAPRVRCRARSRKKERHRGREGPAAGHRGRPSRGRRPRTTQPPGRTGRPRTNRPTVLAGPV